MVCVRQDAEHCPLEAGAPEKVMASTRVINPSLRYSITLLTDLRCCARAL